MARIATISLSLLQGGLTWLKCSTLPSSIFFQPIAANTVNHGELTFGGSNPNIDIITPAPSSWDWGINQWISYGNTAILAYTAGIMDSGCTFLPCHRCPFRVQRVIVVSSAFYERYRTVTGGILNPANGLLQISTEQFIQLDDLEFHIGRET
ncbi:hypothetical protein BDR04DRAFT_1155228 [Suillus decipiens]|nr:hypothetical protein BDR04DRAFT_1155228 [Suillus decipiens]